MDEKGGWTVDYVRLRFAATKPWSEADERESTRCSRTLLGRWLYKLGVKTSNLTEEPMAVP